METVERYDAFISYRHCEPDSDIVIRLHRSLENYRLPKEIAKRVGKKRLSRVFRDDAELSVSDDLSEEIDKALRNSDYLIVVCSPDYLKSVWCRKELETFLKYNDKSHVLLVLANGEPETAFPEEMFSNGVEPLAADCRGNTPKERKEHVDTATLRLVAAIIGVGYDDLAQRHRKEVTLKRTRRTLVVFSIVCVILIISVVFLIKIARQNVIITQRYADSLAVTSANLLADGKRLDAVYAARLALNQLGEGDYSEPAIQALVTALGCYDTNGYGCDDDILLPCSASYFFKISSEGRYASVCGLDHVVYVVDLNNRETVTTVDNENANQIFFDGERGFVYTFDDNTFYYRDFETLSDTEIWNGGGYICADSGDKGYTIITGASVLFFKGTQMIYDFNLWDYIPDPDSIARYIDVFYSDDRSRAVVYYRSYVDNSVSLFDIDLEKGIPRKVELLENDIDGLLSTDGTTVVYTLLEEDKSVLYAQDINDPSTAIRSRTEIEEPEGICVSGDDIVVVTSDDMYIFNRELILIRKIDANGSISNVKCTDDGIIVYEFGIGIHVVKDGTYYELCPDVRDSSNPIEQNYCNGTLYLVSTGDNHITTYTYRRSEYLELYDGEFSQVEIASYDDPEFRRFYEPILEHETAFDESRIYSAVICENSDYGLIQLWDGVVYIYDTNTNKCVKTIYSIDGMISSFCYKDGYYYISAESLEVYDSDFLNLYDIEGCRLLGFDNSTGYPVVCAWEDESASQYLVTPLNYDEVIRIADEVLGDYRPDERVREKYSLE